MAKRGTLDHPKTLMLADALDCDDCDALGMMEALWQVTAKFYHTGRLKDVTPRSLCRSIRTKRDPQTVWDALVSCRLIDIGRDGCAYVHDWHEHADDTTKKNLRSRGESFELPDGTTLEPYEKQSRIIREEVANNLRQPKPKPKPKPKPVEKEKEEKKKPAAEKPLSRCAAIVMYLNRTAGREFNPEGHWPELMARLSDGATDAECMMVVDYKANEWISDQKMFKHLNPTTLFRIGHWDQYLADARMWAENKLKPQSKSADDEYNEIMEGIYGSRNDT